MAGTKNNIKTRNKQDAKAGAVTGAGRGFFQLLDESPLWFKVAVLAALMVRLYLVFQTNGTYDIEIWQRHAEQLSRIGLIEYYKVSLPEKIMRFNHPPFAGLAVTFILSICQAIAIPFKVLFRLPFALLDFLAAAYLLQIFASHKNRYVYTAFYLLNPITFILSSYHGNTDAALGLIILMSIFYLSRGNFLAAGLIFGFGAWIKWIIVMMAPALFFAIPDMRRRFEFLAAAGAMFVAGYMWVLLAAPEVLLKSIFQYGGLMIKNQSGFIWGMRIFYDGRWLDWCIDHNRQIIICLVVAYAWLCRQHRSAADMGRTVGGSFCIFYALTNFWAFQYLAWSAPFLVFLGLPVAALLSFAAGGYIYFLYSAVCRSYLLQGVWDLAGTPIFPPHVLFFRNAAMIAFMICAAAFFAGAVFAQLKRRLQ